MAVYGLVMPFLNDDPAFAHGVEFGLLYARMRDGGEAVIDETFLAGNQDQILLAASRMGWHVERTEPVAEGWCRVRMRRGSIG